MIIRQPLELFDQAQFSMDKLSQLNGTSEDFLLEIGYKIHDGRADCRNWMAEPNLEIDELKVMEKIAAKMGDESRGINVLNRQAEAKFGIGDIEGGVKILEKNLKKARQIGEKNEQAQSLLLLSLAQYQKGESDKSSQNIESALALFKETGNLTGQSRCLRSMAFNGVRSGQTKHVQEYAEEALNIARRAGDHQSEGHALNILGIISSDVSRTRDYYKQALDILSTIGDVNGQKTMANNLGLLFWKLGLYGQANYYATQAEMSARALGYKIGLAVSLDGVGRSWFELGDLERAEAAFQEGYSLSQEYGSAFDVAACAMGLGRIAHKRGAFQAAIDHYKRAVELLKDTGDIPETAVILAWMGTAYLKLGDRENAEKITSQAVAHLLATDPNTDLLDQEVWWSRYQVLTAHSDPVSKDKIVQLENEQAWLVLEKARQTMMEIITTISDEGLRRNYLTKVKVNRKISEEWTRLYHNRPEFKEFTDPGIASGDLQEQFKRLAEIGSRLTTQRDPDKLPDFIMNEVVELNGAGKGISGYDQRIWRLGSCQSQRIKQRAC